ncbi:Mut7-C RNAse domain-containing protein [Salinarchaeum sp. IM2453]|uniref:Mut7-C RNAse domain-containing protein n=1 Tax=Salinarchaeum sp. IM2453 TaxID=2862870 RepID=UPI001C83251B|nr:Mut7-C RNAse domain-containing protein [Salinarchaeum sp. IM2453]QZA88938.1 Mut7-C RNAse domain-containing protein [Salinarchaeum sp. IM2453]
MRLLLDAMCGSLASYLRMCSHDTVYALDQDITADDALLELSESENRTLITRNQALADRATNSILLTSKHTTEQLSELHGAGVPLILADQPEYCGQCNGDVQSVPPATTVPDYVPSPDTESIWQCQSCGQYFWKGGHWDQVKSTLEQVKEES